MSLKFKAALKLMLMVILCQGQNFVFILGCTHKILKKDLPNSICNGGVTDSAKAIIELKFAILRLSPKLTFHGTRVISIHKKY